MKCTSLPSHHRLPSVAIGSSEILSHNLEANLGDPPAEGHFKFLNFSKFEDNHYPRSVKFAVNQLSTEGSD